MTGNEAGGEVYAAQRLREALATDPRVGELELEVAEAAGKLFVSGMVGTEERRRAIDEVARELDLGMEVTNETVVARFPPDPDREELS